MLMQMKLHDARRAGRGLSLIEMMVGIALGMILVAGASTMFVTHLTNGRRLLLEARLEQDMRAAADLIARDIRRAGYWGNALAGTVAAGASSATATNPYRVVTTGAGTINYSFSRDGAVDNGVLDNNEQFGFDLNAGVIRMQLATGTVQPVTDIDTLTIDTFTVAPTVVPVDVRDACARTCCDVAGVAAGLCANPQINVAAPATCPTITVRQYLVTLIGHATRDSTVTRTLQTRVRARNDLFSGTCPA